MRAYLIIDIIFCMARKKRISENKEYDWAAIKAAYRLGNKSLRVLSAEFGPSHGQIGKRAKKENWPQDKTSEVRELTAVALTKETGGGDSKGDSGNSMSPDEIRVAVATNVEVVLGHRKHIAKSWKLAEQIEEQLEESITNREEIEKALADYSGDEKQLAMMLQAVNLPKQVKMLSDLSGIFKNIIPLERQAYSLDEERRDDTGKRNLDGIPEQLADMFK